MPVTRSLSRVESAWRGVQIAKDTINPTQNEGFWCAPYDDILRHEIVEDRDSLLVTPQYPIRLMTGAPDKEAAKGRCIPDFALTDTARVAMGFLGGEDTITQRVLLFMECKPLAINAQGLVYQNDTLTEAQAQAETQARYYYAPRGVEEEGKHETIGRRFVDRSDSLKASHIAQVNLDI